MSHVFREELHSAVAEQIKDGGQVEAACWWDD